MKKVITGFCLILCSMSIAFADELETYRVTITNGTLHHVITPPLIVTHHNQFQIFQIGQPASEGLAILAESGNNQPLLMEIESADGVIDVIAGAAPILYGQSASFEIQARKKALISLVGMLASTNDGFAAINGLPLPNKASHYVAHVFDAGSESNNENCAYVPGPPCAADSGNASDEGEGYVSFHNGIHGVGDLDPMMLDWRGSVAVVSITRLDD